MLNLQKKIHSSNHSKNPAKTLIILILHVFLLVFVVYSLLTIISIILPWIFECLYTLSTQLLTLMVPVSILISSLLVILLPNPIYSLIALILVFLNTAIFLLSIKVQFLALIYLIVYIGAIAILFLFVIMLFNLRSLQKSDLKMKDFTFLTISFKFYFFFGVKFFCILALEIGNLLEYSTYFQKEAVYQQFDLQYFLTYVHWDILLFSNLFYTYYSYIFLLSGLVLLAAMIGSIVLALSTTEPQISNHKESRESSNAIQRLTVKDLTDDSEVWKFQTQVRHISYNARNSQSKRPNKLQRFWNKLTWDNIKLNRKRLKVWLWILGLSESPTCWVILVPEHIDDYSNKGRRMLPLVNELYKKNPHLKPIEKGKNFVPHPLAHQMLSIYHIEIIITELTWDHRNDLLTRFWFYRYSRSDGTFEDSIYQIYDQYSTSEFDHVEFSPSAKKMAGLPDHEQRTWLDFFWRDYMEQSKEARARWKY